MAAIPPFNFAALFEGKPAQPAPVSVGDTLTAFEDALAGMLGGGAFAPEEHATPIGGPLPPRAAAGLSDCRGEEASETPLGPRLALVPPVAETPPPAADNKELAVLAVEDPAPAEREIEREDAEEIRSEEDALLTNPHAFFATWPWVPETDRGGPPPAMTTNRLPDVPHAVETKDGVSAGSVLANVLPLHRDRAARSGEPVRRTLRFPPPPESELQALRELAPPDPSPARGPLEGDRREIRAREAKERPKLGAVEPPAAPRIERGFMALPSFVGGGRIEWTIESPITPANDPHRSVSAAIAAVEHEERTVRAEAPSRNARERSLSPARAETREPVELRGIAAALAPVERAEAPDLFVASPPEAPTFVGLVPSASSETQVESRPLSSAVHHVDMRGEASRERRQDDAELTVSQMTLSHRVEARTVVDDLGSITVRAETRDGAMQVSLAADRSETIAFLDQNRGDLTRELRASAPTVSDVSVRADTGGSSGDRQHHRSQPDWAAGTPITMAAATADSRTISANGKRVRIVL